MKLKKALAIVMTACMTLAMVPVVALGATTVSDYDEFIDAVNAGGEVVLDNDIVLTAGVNITNDVVLNLNGKNITGNSTFTGDVDYLLAVKRGGKLTIKGSGTIDAENTMCAIKMTVKGEAATGTTDGIAELVVNGGTIKGNKYPISGNGLRHDTKITINGGAIIGGYVGIFQPQNGELNINGGTIEGTTGVEVRSGSVTITGGTISGGTGEYGLTGSGNGFTTKNVGLAVVPHGGETITAVVSGDANITGSVGAVVTANDGPDTTTAKDGNATLTVKGGASIEGTAIEGYGLRVLDGATATVTDDASVKAPQGYGIYVRGLEDNATDKTTLNVSGGSISGKLYGIAGNGYAKNGGTNVNITGGQITSDGVAIYNPQSGKLSITGDDTYIEGTTGVYALDGEIDITGGTIIGNGAVKNVSQTSNGAVGTGAAVVFETNSTYSGSLDASISGGYISSENNVPVQAEKTAGDDEPEKSFISGGSFSEPISKELLADNVYSYAVPGGNNRYFDNEEDAIEAAQGLSNILGENIPVYSVNDLDASGEPADDAEPIIVTPAPVFPTFDRGQSVEMKVPTYTVDAVAENGEIGVHEEAKVGEKVIVVATPDKGYVLTSVKVYDRYGKEIALTAMGGNNFYFTMPYGNVKIEAIFEKYVPTEADMIVLTIGSKDINVFGEVVAYDVAPEIVGGYTMLPGRAIVEALGGTISWDATLQKVTVVKDGKTIEFYIGKDFAMVDGQPVVLNTPAYIKDGRTFIEVRTLTENLGADIQWNGETSEVTIIPGK